MGAGVSPTLLVYEYSLNESFPKDIDTNYLRASIRVKLSSRPRISKDDWEPHLIIVSA